jgi:hypothetical protein
MKEGTSGLFYEKNDFRSQTKLDDDSRSNAYKPKQKISLQSTPNLKKIINSSTSNRAALNRKKSADNYGARTERPSL